MKLKFVILLLISGTVLSAAPLTLGDCYGKWQDKTYLFLFKKNYTASVVIYVNNSQAYVFNGIYTIEKDSLIRINLNEMKSCARSMVFARSGFTRTASSKFVFAAESADKGKALTLRPKEIIIDGEDSSGYFDQIMKLGKN